jgi:superfamily II DNA or RNA helicase
MVNIFKEYYDDADDFKFHVGSGFFFLDGFGELYDIIDITKLKPGSESYEKYWGTVAPILVMMGKETNKTTKEALIDAENMVTYALNTHEKEYLEFLEQLIDKDLIKFKVFTDQRFHAKIYFFYNGNSVDDIYVGSANLTSAGLTRNIELTAPMSADKFRKRAHKEWFHNLWNRATDDLNVLEIIKAYKKHDFIYYEPKTFFENLIKLMDKDYLFYNSDISDNTLLVKFQSFDFYQVMSTLEKYNGCILASSVGLGKSYVALEVMRYFENNSMNALLIGPPGLVKGKNSQWGEYLRSYGLNVEKISYGDLQQEDFDASHYLDYELVVIDEAHNLRNASNRRKNMMQIIRNSPKAKYLLLTATPINVHISDLTSLIDLFYEVNKDKWLDKDLKKRYETFKTKVNKLEKSKSDTNNQLEEVVNLQEHIEKELIVKSTRSMVKEYFSEDLHKLAGTDKIEEPIVHKETFKYPKEYLEKVFNKLPDFLVSLNYEHSKFQKQEDSYEYHEDKNLIYLYKWVLYKRAESSIYAFYSSIKKLRDRINTYIHHLESVTKYEDFEYKLEPGIEERLETASIIFDSFETDQQRGIVIKNMKEDIVKITRMIDGLEEFKNEWIFRNDKKLEQLKDILLEYGNKKCIIFTEYFATLEYLTCNLKDEFSVDYVAGQDLKRNSMRPSIKENKIKRFKEKDFQHLISTDVLSEGFNLPEADVVINYDLPYNPVKIIQRVGRATRINVPKQIEIRNFQPDETIDQELNLVEKLDMRISNIISMIGIDYSIWTDTEHLVKEKEQKDSVNKCKVLKELKNRIATENPEEIYQVRLRDESKLDILLKNGIEHYNIQQEDLPVRKPTKPIYSTLVDNKPGFYGIYKLKKDFYEYGAPAKFIEEPPHAFKHYNNNEIMEFCTIIKEKYGQLMWKKRDQGISHRKDKEIINKLEIIRKEVPGLSDVVNKIFKSQLHTNFQISTLINEEIYPSIMKDDFIWITRQDLIEEWEEKMNKILESEDAENILFLDETLKKPEAYKEMITAFIQYKEAGSDD